MVVVRNWMKEVIADTDTDTLTHLCIGCVGGRGVISGRGALVWQRDRPKFSWWLYEVKGVAKQVVAWGWKETM
ncbi:hypothetical protein M6B38_287430 [Iris pallida]|uniref:Uncharacterized protein n=1 Tax=Iris pallida TaxID=29817 RepID=A0AAX6HZ89_IRIPA|nr:hypothetical protein M6B38_287430 [Iris pallida]